MINDVVTYRVENRVAWVTIQREEARNALSKAVRDGLWAGVRRFNADDSALVLVLTGSGPKVMVWLFLVISSVAVALPW